MERRIGGIHNPTIGIPLSKNIHPGFGLFYGVFDDFSKTFFPEIRYGTSISLILSNSIEDF